MLTFSKENAEVTDREREDCVVASEFEALFGGPPDIIASAPGRIEFIGNHTDYNGGPVLGAAIDREVLVALSLRSDNQRHLTSDYRGEGFQTEIFEGTTVTKQIGNGAWTNYPMGVLASLPAFGLRAPDGFNMLVRSSVPVGAGLSSSAAIELASALAFLGATCQPNTRELIARIGRHAENNFVGVPCGILDQGVSAFGRRNHLVYVDAFNEQFDAIPIPNGARLWVFNSHAKHSLVESLYSERHRECMLAAKEIGVSMLVEASPERLAGARGRLSPAVFRRAQHVIDEIARVHSVIAALKSGNLHVAGHLLTASHRSSQFYFENSTPELDFLVDGLVGLPNVYGARLTGGGFGGSVLALTDSDFTRDTAAALAEKYRAHFGAKVEILSLQTSEGARLVRSGGALT
jgi:galactokinase